MRQPVVDGIAHIALRVAVDVENLEILQVVDDIADIVPFAAGVKFIRRHVCALWVVHVDRRGLAPAADTAASEADGTTV